MATWKKILTTGDAVTDNIATSNLTCTEAIRGLNLGNSSGVGIFAIADNSSNAILSVSHDQSTDVAAVVISGETRIAEDDGGNQGLIKLFEGGTATNYVGLKAPTLSANYTLTLPTTDGNANQVLKTNGSGVLSWVDQSSGSGTIDGTGSANKIAIWSDTDTLTNDTDLSWSSSTNTLSSVNFNASSGVTCAILTADAIMIPKQPDTNAAGAYDGAGTRLFSKIGSNNVISNGAGKVCYLGGSGTGTWALADKDAESTSIGLLAIYPNSGGPSVMVREGVVKMASNQGFSTATAGTALYLGDDGAVQTAVPGTGDIARIVGYVLNASSSIIYFCPDNSYVKVS